MYRAKELGRNSYQLCTRAMNSRAAERLSIENALRRAIERERARAVLPAAGRASRRARRAGMEALLRWNRPGARYRAPVTFIGIAEETRHDRPDRGVGAARGLRQAHGSRGATPAARRRQPLAAPVPADRPREVVASALEESELDASLPRAGDHREHGHAQHRPHDRHARASCASSACASPSTTSAPATPRSATCAASRSTA